MKKIIIKLSVLCMLIVTLVGCVSKQPNDDLDSTKLLYIDAYSIHEMAMIYLTDMGDETLETGSIEFEITAGKTVEEIIKLSDYMFKDVVCEYDIFEGWLQYEVIITPGDDGFDVFTYELVSDQVISTEEMLSSVIDGSKNISFTAKWASLPIEDYYTDEEEFVEGYTGVVALTANGGKIATIMGDKVFSEEETTILGLAQGENNLNDSFKNNKYSIDITKQQSTLNGFTVYQADALNLVYEDCAKGYWFGKDFEGLDTWITMTNETLVSENMSIEEVYQLEPNNGVYFVIANWQ